LSISGCGKQLELSICQSKDHHNFIYIKRAEGEKEGGKKGKVATTLQCDDPCPPAVESLQLPSTKIKSA
jgi:hypothetical protein